MQEAKGVPVERSTELLKEMVDISRDLQRVNSYLINGQCILAYRHAVAMRNSFGTRSEPKQVLESMIRLIYDGKQVQAEADLKRLGDILKAAYEDILKTIKEKQGEETTVAQQG